MSMLDTPDAIEWYRRQVMLHRMELELKGIRFRVNTFAAARKELNLPLRTPRKKVLAAYKERYGI